MAKNLNIPQIKPADALSSVVTGEQTTTTPVQNEEPVKKRRKKKYEEAGEEPKITSFQMLPSFQKRLKAYAVEHDTTITDVLIKALNEYMERNK